MNGFASKLWNNMRIYLKGTRNWDYKSYYCERKPSNFAWTLSHSLGKNEVVPPIFGFKYQYRSRSCGK